jgi:hypothetical protein
MSRFVIGRRGGRVSFAIAMRLRVIAKQLSRRPVTLVAVHLGARLVLAFLATVNARSAVTCFFHIE